MGLRDARRGLRWGAFALAGGRVRMRRDRFDDGANTAKPRLARDDLRRESSARDDLERCRRAMDADGGLRSECGDARLPRDVSQGSTHRRPRLSAHGRAGYGVRWIDNYDLKRDADETGGELDYAKRAGIADLYADIETIDPATLPFVGFKNIRRFATMLMEPNTFLPAVERDFLLQGGRIVVRTFHTASDVAALHEPVVFNCTGLGSRALFNDNVLEPVRGQLSILEPQPAVDYIYLAAGPLYMFPRSDGIALGGTFERENWSTEVDLATQARILAAHEAIFSRV